MNAVEYAENASELFVLPEICTRIRELLDDDKSNLDDIAELICLDPALSAKLLKLANSAFYSFPVEIDNLAKAIAIIGENAVYNLVIADGTTAAFAKVDKQHIDLQQFWELSVDCGLMMKQLGRCIGVKNAEQLFVVGLLHHIGQLVLVQAAPDTAVRCQQFTGDRRPWQLQQQEFGFTFAECAAELLTLWQIPETISLPIRQQHNSSPEMMVTESRLLYVASRLALVNNYPDLYTSDDLIATPLLDRLGLCGDDLEDALTFAKMESFNILGIINPRAVTVF